MKFTAESLSENLGLLFQKYNPKLVYFFGSAYRGKIGPLSDIDLAVLWPEGVNAPMLKSLELQNEVNILLYEHRFEVGCLNGQILSFCYSVIGSGKCIYGNEEDRVRYETEILSQYLDFSYLGEEYNSIFDKKLMGGKDGQ